MGNDALEALASRADRSGVFLDFDGTLSEIAQVPSAAKAVPGAADLLSRLAERFGIVAVVSGRMASEVKRRLGGPQGVRFFGLYGAEGTHPVDEGPQDHDSRVIEEILPRVLELAAAVPGSLVEPKGWNLAIHYRLSPDPEEARSELLRSLTALARGVGLTIIEGKRVLEMVPSGAPTKGDLVAREGAGLEGILYAGDDLADIEAFAAVDVLAERGAHSVKVAVRSAETPPELLEAADLTVEGPEGLLRILGALAG